MFLSACCTVFLVIGQCSALLKLSCLRTHSDRIRCTGGTSRANTGRLFAGKSPSRPRPNANEERGGNPMSLDGFSDSKDSKDMFDKDAQRERERESMFSVSYDPLESPSQVSLERDLEDMMLERGQRFYHESLVRVNEVCYLVGLEDKSSFRGAATQFTMEESLTELSELAGAAGLKVIGSTYQRLERPDTMYYIGAGKTNDIKRAMAKNKCCCVILDAELSPSQQKNLEIAFNSENTGNKGRGSNVKVVDRTALILDIFAQHVSIRDMLLLYTVGVLFNEGCCIKQI